MVFFLDTICIISFTLPYLHLDQCIIFPYLVNYQILDDAVQVRERRERADHARYQLFFTQLVGAALILSQVLPCRHIVPAPQVQPEICH